MGLLLQPSHISHISIFLIFSSHICVADEQAKPFFYQLDFTQMDQVGKKWMIDQGFKLAKEMKSKGDIQFTVLEKSGGLSISTVKSAFGMAVNKTLHFEGVKSVEIEWGVKQYPQGASWSDEINREALMVQLFFGPKVKADKIYLPPTPYFIGLFLCHDDPVFTPFVGKSYKQTGRYICLDAPAAGETVVSRVDIAALYKRLFNTTEVPPVTGIGFELDTSDLDEGSASGFIKRVTLYPSTHKR